MMLKRGLFLFVSALPAVAFAAATLTMLTVMTRGTALFSFHPIFMAAAFCLCMPYGLGAYRFAVLDSASKDTGGVLSMVNLRSNHRAWQMAAGMCALAGLVVIVANKVSKGHSPFQLSLHAWFGMAALLGILVQSIVGILKMNTLAATGAKTMGWHGYLGLLVYSVGIVAMGLGCVAFFGAFAAPAALVIMIPAIAVWAMVMIVRLSVDYPGRDLDCEYTPHADSP